MAAGETLTDSGEARGSLAEQRRALPDQPGVYLFRDARGRVIYVGKAKSVRKRVASHFSKAQVPSSPGHAEMVASVERASSASSSPPRPRRCSPSRASSSSTGRASTSACATTSPIRSSRSRSTRTIRACTSRASATGPGRAYFGPYSNAKRVRGDARGAREGVHVPLVHRPRAGTAQRQPVPRLLHQALRGAVRGLRVQGASTARASTA